MGDLRAGFVAECVRTVWRTREINPQAADNVALFDEQRLGAASETVRLVAATVGIEVWKSVESLLKRAPPASPLADDIWGHADESRKADVVPLSRLTLKAIACPYMLEANV